ncbi:hypothetical protein SAMN05660900_00842, partial [Megasphaera cerevisiae DSM 20462]
MANESNFLIFNTDNSSTYTYSDSEYSSESQRTIGVQTGQAKSRLHNKMFRQWSVMAYMLGQLIANSGHDAEDSDPDGLLAGFKAAIAGNSNISNTVWKPSTTVSAGTVVKTPNMPTWAYVVCTTAGTTSATEPSWGAVADATITDNTVVWTLRSYLPFIGATSSAAGTSGIVPVPSAGDQNKVLTGGAVFKDILTLLTAFTGATASAAGTLGGVPAPTAGQQLNVLTGAGSFQTLATLLAAYGVQYNIAQNGYVKFGDLFGGLIIQWG